MVVTPTRRSNGWAARGAEIIRAEQERRPSPLLPCAHPKESLRMRNTVGGFEFTVDALTGTATHFRHGLVVRCAECGNDLDPQSRVAREAVMFYLANNPAAKLARIVGHGLGVRGTRRPALEAERKADV